MADDLGGLLDQLYSAPPAEFVAVRNETVKALRNDGRKEEAVAFKALKKPSTAAWVVNQLHFRHHSDVEELIAGSEALREAHQTPDADIHEAMERRRSQMDRLLVVAKDLLEAGGFAPTREQMRRINRTLEAATTSGADYELGRLVQDLEPAGFGALSGLAFSAAPPTNRADGGSSASKAKTNPRDKAKPKANTKSTSKGGPASRTKAKSKNARTAVATEAEDRAAQQWAAEARLKVEEKKLERAERQVTLAETAHLAAGRYIERATSKIDELNERLAQANDTLDQAKTDALTKREYLDDARDALERATKRVQEAKDGVDLARG